MPYKKATPSHENDTSAIIGNRRAEILGQKHQEQVDAFKQEWVPKVGASVIAEGYGLCRVLDVVKGSAFIEYTDKYTERLKTIWVRVTSLKPSRTGKAKKKPKTDKE